MSKKNTLENKKSRKLERELIAYSLAAGTVLLGAAGASAAIHHTDLGAGVVLDTDGASLDIDFDGGGAEFNIFFSTATDQVNVQAETASASWRGTTSTASALDNGAEVNTGANWGRRTTGNGGNLAYYWSSAWTGGDFIGTSDKYIGVKFDIGGDTLYGWIQVQVPADSTSATITGYAYNDVDDGSITAGQVPEPASLALLALGAAGIAAWRKK